MRKLAYILPLLFLLSFTTDVNDAKATAILKKVSAVYQKYKTMKSTFTLNTTDRSNKTTKSTGTLWLKGEKFVLDYSGQTIFCDGKYTWTYNPIDKEVTKEKYKKRNGSISPNEIFSIYKKDFKNLYEGDSKIGTATNYVIKMVPTKRKNYSYLKLYIDKSNNKISQLSQYSKNGTTVTIEVDKFENDIAGVTDASVEWNPAAYPGVTLVDLSK